MCWGLHILLSQECETTLEEFDTLRIGASIVTSQEHGDFTDPWVEVCLGILYLQQNIISCVRLRDSQWIVATLHKWMSVNNSDLRWGSR